jgi:folate-dependent tRNA-U54 methylase TrmFO/GidA
MGESNSILKPNLHLKQYPTITFNNVEEVDLIRLDDSGLDLTDYNFINIEVQGYELEVFKDSLKSLENIDYIMSEINKEELYEGCAKIDELVEFLKGYRFELIEYNWDGVTWGDGLFIKK